MIVAEVSQVGGGPLGYAGHAGQAVHADPPRGVATVKGPTSAPDGASWDEFDEIIGVLEAMGLLGEPPAAAGGTSSEPAAAHAKVHASDDLDGLAIPLTEDAIRASDIKKRPGWTEATIRRFLGPPDSFETNPHCATGAPMRMYSLRRVEVAESRPHFAVWQAGAQERSASARRSFEQGREAALRVADEWVPALPDVPPDELLSLALDDRNDREMSVSDADEFVPLGPDDDPALVQEAVMAFVWRRSLADAAVDTVAPQHRRAVRKKLRDRLRHIIAEEMVCDPVATMQIPGR